MDRVIVQLFTALNDETVAARALNMLEHAQHLKPTHWSSSKLLRDAYSRTAIDEWIRDPGRGASNVLYIRKIDMPAYLASVKLDVPGAHIAARTHLAWFELKTEYRTSVKEAEELAELATHLAVQIEADCGVVDFRPDTPDEQMNPSGREHAAVVATRGLQVLYGRTLVAAKDVGRYGGLEAFRRAGLDVTLVSNTIYQIDLLQAPWSCSARELKDAQLRALNSLRSDGFLQATD